MLRKNQFKRGDVLTADTMNQIVNAVLQALKFTASAPLEISKFGKTTHVRMNQDELFLVGKFETGGCSAASGTTTVTLGSGTLAIWDMTEATGWKLSESSPKRTITAYNLADVAIESDKFVMCRLHPAGIYLVDWELCS